MKIALFSDIHGNLTALEAVFAAIERWGGVDHMIAAGDLIGGYSSTDEVLDLLVAKEVAMVKGDSETEEKLIRLEAEAEANPGKTRSPAWYYRAMREWMEKNLSPRGRAFVDALPHSLTIEPSPGRRLYVCHASPRSVGDRVCAPFCEADTVREAFAAADAEVIAFGHAHESFVRRLDDRTYVNVASVGMGIDQLAWVTLIEFKEEHWIIAQRAVPYDVGKETARCWHRQVPYYP